MSLPIPLTVRLSNAGFNLDVTRQLRDLRFRSTAPGGFASATMSLDRPLTLKPREIGYYSRVYIYDGRSGATVWEGRLEDPGRGNSMQGQVWTLTAMGPAAHTKDRVVPLVYVDRSLERWTRIDTMAGAEAYSTDNPGGSPEQVLLLKFSQALDVVTNSRAVMRYAQLDLNGQKLGRINYAWDAGGTTPNWQVQAVTSGGGGGNETPRADNWDTAGAGLSAKVINTNWTVRRDLLDLRAIRTGGATTIADDNAWAVIRTPVVVATRYDAAGNELTSGATYTADTVLSSEVVADLLGRLLPLFDGANASIATTSYAIEQLAYPDGVDAAGVLDDLMQIDNSYFWAAWESTSTGLWRFVWQAWPTTVRYEADVVDGYESQGSGDGLYDQVTVRWRDPGGVVKTTVRTQTVADLTAAGFSRQAIVDLADVTGSLANAQRYGDNFLADHNRAPNAGQLRIGRPIYDAQLCRLVQPWEIRPGNLIRCGAILPRPDALNVSDRDGTTTFRIVSSEYSTSDAAAFLELDSYTSSTARALADLRTRPVTRRR